MTRLPDQARIALGGLADFAGNLRSDRVRLGVTGLSRSGKTVFITALVHALVHGARLPLFNAAARGRILRCYLEPQPDDALPRFSYENHIASLTGPQRRWPESTRRISQLRVTIEYTPETFLARRFGSGKLHLDIIDYPGEWLLDLPMMSTSYAQWSQDTLAASGRAPRKALAKDWRGYLASLDPAAKAEEGDALKAAGLFTTYLRACRDNRVSLSTLPPGRFLMPGDLEGSPLLTFAPLDVDREQRAPKDSLWAMMERRYDAYVANVVRPFFFNHFARLDRQIVLADTLRALNGGPAAIEDLKAALTSVLSCFRQGTNGVWSNIFGRRIDKILFAATKADQLHHSSHDRLENVLRLIIDDAAARARVSGAGIDVVAMAALRATREATVRKGGDVLQCITGVPETGEAIDGQKFDGKTQAAVFPGDLPDNPALALDPSVEGSLHFVRFRPPEMDPAGRPSGSPSFPHIRLDRAVEFLIGDHFR